MRENKNDTRHASIGIGSRNGLKISWEKIETKNFNRKIRRETKSNKNFLEFKMFQSLLVEN